LSWQRLSGWMKAEFVSLLRESRCRDSFFHQANVVHHPKAAIQNLEHLVDLHPAGAVAVVENCIAVA